MKYFAGLDVSVKETSICIVDETGKICRHRGTSRRRTAGQSQSDAAPCRSKSKNHGSVVVKHCIQQGTAAEAGGFL